MVMTTSANGRKKIAQREGNVLTAHPDPATGGEPWTIGVGHTTSAGPPTVKKGMRITAAQSDEILSRDLATFEAAVSRAVRVPLLQNEFDACVSLAFNIGGSAFARSTVVKCLNVGDKAGAADAFLRFNKAGGNINKGLANRRLDERTQFMDGASFIKPPPRTTPLTVPSFGTAPALAADGMPDGQDETRRAVQQRLKDLGFTMVGKADGWPGPRTDGAIAAFQHVNGTDDAETLKILSNPVAPAKALPIDPSRVLATAKDLAPDSGIIRHADKLIKGGIAGAVGLPSLTVLTDYLPYLDTIRGFFAAVPAVVWAMLATLVLGVVIYQAWTIRAKRVQMHRIGETA